MMAVLQRVKEASITVAGNVTGRTGPGLLILLGVGKGDQKADAEYLASKIVNLRIFPDEAGKMNRSVLDVKGGLLVASQFTLYGDCRKGRRPAFDQAADPTLAKLLYDYFFVLLCKTGLNVESGIFQAHMEISLVNDGPVTLICHS
ncbi:MAG TPA: D-aminoacyl-tRNA deacylase [Bryobacteraceae bacterium]|jgi:D-tyrosyl-tRNA(Tyr) deacylase|nr:D-aminoacyl-tRNA deacylase [Bryobacteraceae bacterium]